MIIIIIMIIIMIIMITIIIGIRYCSFTQLTTTHFTVVKKTRYGIAFNLTYK